MLTRRRQMAEIAVSIVASLILSSIVLRAQTQQQEATPAVNLSALRFRYVGPQGNRVDAVIGVPGDPQTFYIGAASGGVWKSTDGGIIWKPIFDGQDAQSIGSLAVAPSDHNILWAGTGETFIRSNISIGNGIYKSEDAGKTWKNMGLEKTGRIGRVLIDPRNPNVVFAAAMGTCYGPQQERGVYRTLDGGKNWERVLFVDENTGASDVAMDPKNPQNMVAGMWQLDIKTWGKFSGGLGSGVFTSHDGGTTWKRVVGHGLPDSPVGKVGVTFAPSDPTFVYADIETGSRGVVWRSEDGGANWKVVSYNRDLNSRPHYNTRITVSPVDPREIYIIADLISVSYDGGEQTTPIKFADNHDMWIDPLDANRMIIGHDGGADISTDHGGQWSKVVLPIAQIYHVYSDNRVPYFVYGNRQDGQSMFGPSNTNTTSGSITSGDWSIGPGGESGFLIPDPVDNNIIWGGSYAGWLDVMDFRTHQKRSVAVWPKTPMGSPAGLLKYRLNWTFPIAISPFDHNKVYIGSQYVHQTTNGGQTWTVISPDLSTGDASRLASSGGITEDNLGPEYGGIVFAIAESPVEKGLIWAGTNDGLVHITRDGGGHWANVTAGIPNLPPLGTVSNIEPSKYDADTAYITFDLHQVNNRDPFVFKTTDYGKTWSSISSDIPKSVFSYVHCVREDPVRKGLLYLGTENGLYISFNDGEHWLPLQNNLPHAPVDWIAIQPQFNDLLVATYGRGIYIMDDITPLQQMSERVTQPSVYFFSPRPAYRFADRSALMDAPNDQTMGKNPPYGASLDYYLSRSVSGDIALTVQDASGAVIRTLRASNQPGINRVWWDLRYPPPREVMLRTTPPGDPHVWEKKEYRDARENGGGRLLRIYRADDGNVGVRVAPGIYTLKLVADGRVLTQKVEVKKDPNATGTQADVEQQEKEVLVVERGLNSVVDALNQMEWIGKELEDTANMLDHANGDESARTATAAIRKKLYDIEAKFSDPTLAESDWKRFRKPMMLYGEFLVLNFDMMSADFRPTDAQLAVSKEIDQERIADLAELDQFIANDLPAFNKFMGTKGLEGVAAPKR